MEDDTNDSDTDKDYGPEEDQSDMFADEVEDYWA